MYLPNPLSLLSLLPLVPILAKDFFTRPKVQFETPETYAGQKGLGSTLIENLMKTLSAQFGGEGFRRAGYKGAESVKNFQPFEKVGATGGGFTSSPLPNLGPLGNAIGRTREMQGREREVQDRTKQTKPEFDTTPREIPTTAQERSFADTYKTGTEDMNIGVDKIISDIMSQLEKRTPGGSE